MTLVQIANQGWGWVADAQGNGRASLAVTLTGGTVYTAADGLVILSSLVTDSRGVIPGWITSGTYTLTVSGVSSTVEAVSGAVVAAQATPRAFVGPTVADVAAQAAAVLASGTTYSYTIVSASGATLDLGSGKVA